MAISNRLPRKAVGSRTRGQTLHTINEILVHSREDKDLLTSPQTRFRVTVNCQGIGVEAELVFYKKECKWVMVVGNR